MPPWEAKKMLLSSVTQGIGYGPRWRHKMDFIDIIRAYFCAPAERNVYIKLLMEDFEKGMCGKLRKSMYATRDASLNWEEEYVRFMRSVGVLSGKSSPCLFSHPGKDLRVVVYGDDFTILGAEHHLDWLKNQIKEVYEIDFKARLGPHDGDTKVVRLLTRIIEWKHDGIYMEADPRHAEIIVEHLQLENCVLVSTPNEKIKLTRNI